jgi:hypothetical protein
MDPKILLGVSAGFVHLIAFLIYNRQMVNGDSIPNTATWSLWVALSCLNCVTYVLMTHDWVKGLLPLASSIACMATFIFTIFRGKLSRLNRFDSIAMIIGFATLVVWWATRSATYTNLMLQVCLIVSLVPTYRSTWKNPAVEKPLPWFIWGLAYALSAVLVIVRWNGRYEDFVYPVVSLMAHSGMGFLCLRRIHVVATPPLVR